VSSDIGVGDIEIPTLLVDPGDATTAGTLTVTAPDGTQVSPSVTPDPPDSGRVRLVAEPVTYGQPGRWTLNWAVTGTGASAETVEVYVTKTPLSDSFPVWTPGRTRVANYVPLRTLARDAETFQNTFNSETQPNGVQVDRLIADAVSRILAHTGEIAPTLHEFASTVAAILAAAAVERGYAARPEEHSLQRARDLEAQGLRMLSQLVEANQRPDQPGAALPPLWSFPPPVPWGDENFL